MTAGSSLILVTGASGFIGRALCRHLVQSGYRVRGLVRSVPEEPVRGVDYVRMGPFDDLCEGISGIVHLAGAAHGRGGDSRESLYTTNVAMTETLAKAAIEAGVGRFLFVSSIGVNGPQTHGSPITLASPEAPSELYAESKWEAEKRLVATLNGSATAYTIVRPPLVYGVEAPGNFRRLLTLVDSGLPLPFANASNKRTIVSIDNLISLLVRALEHPGAKNRVFLATDGKTAVSTRQIVEVLREGMGRPRRLFPVPVRFLGFCARLVGRGKAFSQLYGDLEIMDNNVSGVLGWSPDEDTLSQLKQVAKQYWRDTQRS